MHHLKYIALQWQQYQHSLPVHPYILIKKHPTNNTKFTMCEPKEEQTLDCLT
jgi:hypothetical protein